MNLTFWTVACLWLTAGPVWAGVVGGSIQISQSGGRFPDVVYSTQSHKYLVLCVGLLVYGRLVSSTGQLPGNEIVVSEAQGLFPEIACNAANDEFLVVWADQRPNVKPLYAAWGRRIRASDGQLIGTNCQIGDSGGGRGAAAAWSPIARSSRVTLPEAEACGLSIDFVRSALWSTGRIVCDASVNANQRRQANE
jgi:hypothetical protein